MQHSEVSLFEREATNNEKEEESESETLIIYLRYFTNLYCSKCFFLLFFLIFIYRVIHLIQLQLVSIFRLF